MKGKLEILLAEGHLANLPEFETLHKNHLSRAEKLKKSKAAADRALLKLDEKLAQGRMDTLFTLEPKTAFLIAKYRKKIAKAEFELDRKRLESWIEGHLKRPENAELSKYLDKKAKEAPAKTEKPAVEKPAKSAKPAVEKPAKTGKAVKKPKK